MLHEGSPLSVTLHFYIKKENKQLFQCLDPFNLKSLINVRICSIEYYGRIKMGLELRNTEQDKV